MVAVKLNKGVSNSKAVLSMGVLEIQEHLYTITLVWAYQVDHGDHNLLADSNLPCEQAKHNS